MAGNVDTTLAYEAIIRRLQTHDRRLRHLNLGDTFAHAGIVDCFTLALAISQSRCLRSIHVSSGVEEHVFVIMAQVLRCVQDITDLAIHVPDPALGRDVVGVLKCNQSFQRLEIYGDGITDMVASQIAEALRPNTSMKVLVLRSPHIGDRTGVAIAELLCQGPFLSLHLAGGGLTDAAGVALARALQTNTKLRWLKVQAAHLREETAVAMAEMLASNETLWELSVWSTDWNDVAAANLAECLKTNATLFSVSFGSAQWDELTCLHFVDALRVNSSVTSFALSGMRLPGLAESFVRQNKELSELWWRITMIVLWCKDAVVRETVDAMGAAGLRCAIVSCFLSRVHFRRLAAKFLMSDPRPLRESSRRAGCPRRRQTPQRGRGREGPSKGGGRSACGRGSKGKIQHGSSKGGTGKSSNV